MTDARPGERVDADGRGQPSPPPDAVTARFVTVGVVFAIVAVAIQAAVHLTNVLVFGGRWDVLNADLEGSVFAWASSSATFAAAFAALMLAIQRHPRSLPFAVLAALLAYFSLDDAMALHERAGRATSEAVGLPVYMLRVFWVAIYVPLLALTLVLLLDVSRQASASIRRHLHVALLFFGAAIFTELLATIFFAGGGDFGTWPDALQVAFEEGAELAAWILVASGLAAAVVDPRFRTSRG